MKTLLTILVVFSQNASADNDQKWDFFIESIDPYADSAPNNARPTSSGETVTQKTNTSPPHNGNMSIQEISLKNQAMQKALRKQQIESSTRRYSSINIRPAIPDKPDTRAGGFNKKTHNYDEHSGFYMQSASFDWGNKKSGYKYKDYIFKFDANDSKQAKHTMDTISQLIIDGWEIDLTRSSQEIEGKGDNIKALTTSQMRFMRKKQ